MNTLTHEYWLFIMKLEKKTFFMICKNDHSHDESHENSGKVFLNEDLDVKVLRFLKNSWQPKVTIIYKSKDLSSMNLDA